MKCNYCGFMESKVLDSRTSTDCAQIRRRRECLGCGKRFTTYETVETSPMLVIKNSGVRQQLDIQKIKNGLLKACEKRNISMSEIDQMVANVEKQLYATIEDEVTSKRIGELVMAELKNKDHVAYIRFASVYRQFRDLTTFTEFINEFEKILKE